MPRALSPRHGKSPHGTPRRSAPLPRDVVDDVRQTAHQAQAQEALGHLERAVELLGRGDPRQAAKEARKAKDAAPRSGAVREVLALALYGSEDWRDALREMQAYRRLTGRQDENHIVADCYRALGSPDKAVPLAEQALRAPISGDVKAEAVIVGASALGDMGRYDEGLALLRRLSNRADVGREQDLRVWYVTGDLFARAGRREDAAREFKRITRHDPTAFDAAERLADLS
jgi:tetratricopeptide (TPR) repeat protein